VATKCSVVLCECSSIEGRPSWLVNGDECQAEGTGVLVLVVVIVVVSTGWLGVRTLWALRLLTACCLVARVNRGTPDARASSYCYYCCC